MTIDPKVFNRIVRQHLLYCDSETCALRLHLIEPGKDAYQKDGKIFCEECAAAIGPLPAE